MFSRCPGQGLPLRARWPWMPDQPATASDTVLIFLTWATASSSTTRTLTEEQVIYSSMVTYKVKLPSIQWHLMRCSSMRSSAARLLRHLWDSLLLSVITRVGQLLKAHKIFLTSMNCMNKYVVQPERAALGASASAWVVFEESIYTFAVVDTVSAN